MSQSSIYVKIVVFVPETHADAVREAIGKAGAGKIGNYTHCSFSSQGIGRFKPEEGAHPAVGKIGKIESGREERIEAGGGRTRFYGERKRLNRAGIRSNANPGTVLKKEK